MNFFSLDHLMVIICSAAIAYVDRKSGGGASMMDWAMLYGIMLIVMNQRLGTK